MKALITGCSRAEILINLGQTRHGIEECFKKGIIGSECFGFLFFYGWAVELFVNWLT
jgi:hypothetical protein